MVRNFDLKLAPPTSRRGNRKNYDILNITSAYTKKYTMLKKFILHPFYVTVIYSAQNRPKTKILCLRICS